MRVRTWLLAVSVLCAVSSCGGEDSVAVFEQPETQYVMDILDLPFTTADSSAFGADLDGNGTIDNRLGEILGALVSYFPPDHDAEMATIMATGRIVHLFSVYAETPQESSKAAVWEFIGQPLSAPGTPASGGTFSVDSTLGLGDLIARGSIHGGGGAFGDDETQLAIHLPLTSTVSLVLPVYLARIELDVAADGTLEGTLAGAVKQSDVETKVLAAVNTDITAKCTMGATCTCEVDSGAAVMQDMLDTDGDCTVTLAEVQANAALQLVIGGDLVLDDGSPAVSFGVGFHAVPASFTHAAPPQ